MNNIRGAIENTVSISQFNRGLAGKIFNDVRQNGAKVVMKNNLPECVLISPEDYINLLNQLEDNQLLQLADERLKHFDSSKLIPQSEIDEKFGLSTEDYSNFDDVEFE